MRGHRADPRRRGAARHGAACHVVERRAQFPGHGAADRARRPGLELARRLRRAVFVRPRSVFRHRLLCHRDPADALRRQRLGGFLHRHRCGRTGRRHHRRTQLPLGLTGLLFRAGDARLRRGAAHRRQRRADHRGRRRHADQARPAAGGLPIPEPSAVLLDHSRAGRFLDGLGAPDRGQPLRRLSRGRARE